MEETAVRSASKVLETKNQIAESSINDLFELVTTTAIEPSVRPVSEKEMQVVHKHYGAITYQALLNSVKTSLSILKKRACSKLGAPKPGGGFHDVEPFFEVDVQLSVPSVRLSPSLEDIQRAINRSAVAILGTAKRMFLWGQTNVPDKDKKTYYEILGKDVQVVKIVLLLTGAMRGWINTVSMYLSMFSKYEWLWRDDKEMVFKRFMSKKVAISDFEAELRRFVDLEQEILRLEQARNIGALRLNTNLLKPQLCSETRIWKVLFSNNVHRVAKEQMTSMYEYMHGLNNKLNIEVNSLDVLRYVMGVLKEVREKESSVELDVAPIIDMYTMLENYIPGGIADFEELEQTRSILTTWTKVVEHAEAVANSLSAVQGTYKKQLIWDIREFGMDVRNFRKDFEENGPMLEGIKPSVAVERLKKFKDELSLRERKMEIYRGGEELFAIRPTPFHEVTKTRKEINLIDQLYSLFVDVDASFTSWSKLAWSETADKVVIMTETG